MTGELAHREYFSHDYGAAKARSATRGSFWKRKDMDNEQNLYFCNTYAG